MRSELKGDRATSGSPGALGGRIALTTLELPFGTLHQKSLLCTLGDQNSSRKMLTFRNLRFLPNLTIFRTLCGQVSYVASNVWPLAFDLGYPEVAPSRRRQPIAGSINRREGPSQMHRKHELPVRADCGDRL
jgi:hypothetical protein